MTSADTIYAMSSGAGRAGIAVVRMSGLQSGPVLRAVASKHPHPREFAFVTFRIPDTGEVIDRGVAVWCPAPNSATGEDLAEFHVHGSEAVLAVLFDVFSGLDGVRPAEPGEFLRRAFANGKMDLVEVEGLADLLEARTKSQWRQAMGQFDGRASAVFEDWRSRLVSLIALVEATVDFSDEQGVSEAATRGFSVELESLVGLMEDALRQGEKAPAIRDGVKIVLAGKPNTGKSSLLNALSRRDAAIVSALPGTTRDVIEVQIDLGGVPVLLMDTAGLRSGSGDAIELLGIERSYREIDQADVVVWVSSDDVPMSHTTDEGVTVDLWLRNKSDLENSAPEDGCQVRVSAKSGFGLDEVIDRLTSLVRSRFGRAEQALVVRDRQRVAIVDSIRYLNECQGTDFQYPELLSARLRSAADCLARITGRIGVEDWLGDIFSRFCIGK